MLGLKNLTFDRLTTVFMVISAAMVIFAASGSIGSPSTTTLFIWIVAALVLIGVWIATAYELFKRFFGGHSNSTGGSQRRNEGIHQTGEQDG